MTEEEKKGIGEWLNSPEAGPALAYEMILMHGGGLYFETPETNGFPANRFVGRHNGFMYALAKDRIKIEEEFRVNIETISPYASKEELDALDMVKLKIKEQAEAEIPPFDDGYVGLLEGMSIYINKYALSLLYSEIDIDLNKDCDDSGIPSYASHRVHLKAGLQLAKCDKTREEVIQILMNDGLAEKGATMVVDRMIEVIKQQRKKEAVKEFVTGLFIFLIGAVITGWTYYSAISNGGGKYLITYGALGVGIVMFSLGILKYYKAVNYEG